MPVLAHNNALHYNIARNVYFTKIMRTTNKEASYLKKTYGLKIHGMSKFKILIQKT